MIKIAPIICLEKQCANIVKKKGVKSETNIKNCHNKVVKTCMKAVGTRQRVFGSRDRLPAEPTAADLLRFKHARAAKRKKDVKIILKLLYFLSKIKLKGNNKISNKDVKSIINLIRLLSNKQELLKILEDFDIDEFKEQNFNTIVNKFLEMTSKFNLNQDELRKIINNIPDKKNSKSFKVFLKGFLEYI